jgi:hypothetical protein
MWRSRSRFAGNEERKTRIDRDAVAGRIRRGGSAVNNLAALMKTAEGIGAIGNVGIGTKATVGVPAWISPSGSARVPLTGIPSRVKVVPGFKRVVRAPHGPHARGEVRIEVAVKDRIADDFVAVAAAVESHLQRVTRARADHLAIEIGAFVAVRRLQPLVRVLVMNVSGDVPP